MLRNVDVGAVIDGVVAELVSPGQDSDSPIPGTEAGQHNTASSVPDDVRQPLRADTKHTRFISQLSVSAFNIVAAARVASVTQVVADAGETKKNDAEKNAAHETAEERKRRDIRIPRV